MRWWLDAVEQVCLCSLAKESRQRVRAGPLGLGLLVGLATLSYGLDCGCTKAEILAINDDGNSPSLAP